MTTTILIAAFVGYLCGFAVAGLFAPARDNSTHRRLSVLEAKVNALLAHFEITVDAPAESEDVDQLIASGMKLQAIKLYRDKTGVGLKEAKDAVEDRERVLQASRMMGYR
jgi:ribosomal protein L7/L12